MPSEPKDCLRDILASVHEIQEFTAGASLKEYQRDRRLRLAVERLLQILTEAAYRLGPKGAELCPEIDWNGVRGLGNFLRHEYDKVDDATIWGILQGRIPTLGIAVHRALAKLENRQESL